MMLCLTIIDTNEEQSELLLVQVLDIPTVMSLAKGINLCFAL